MGGSILGMEKVEKEIFFFLRHSTGTQAHSMKQKVLILETKMFNALLQ